MVNLYPFDYDSNLSLAWAYLKLGKKTEARAHYTKASAAGSYAPPPTPSADNRESTGQFELSQNFPNPYTDQTTIPFVLAFAANVSFPSSTCWAARWPASSAWA